MKSTFFTGIGLLSMAANVQATCPVGGCGSKKWCSAAPTQSWGVCKDKLLGGASIPSTITPNYFNFVGSALCHSNILRNGICGCTEQTGVKGCKNSNHYCKNNQCVPKTEGGEGATCGTPGQDRCGTNLYCNSDKICTKKKGSGSSCSENYQCLSNFCTGTSRTCRERPR